MVENMRARCKCTSKTGKRKKYFDFFKDRDESRDTNEPKNLNCKIKDSNIETAVTRKTIDASTTDRRGKKNSNDMTINAIDLEIQRFRIEASLIKSQAIYARKSKKKSLCNENKLEDTAS